MANRKRIGEILIDAGVLDQAQLEKALAVQKEMKRPLGVVLVQQGFVSEQDVMRSLGTQLRLPFLILDGQEIHKRVTGLVPVAFAEEHSLIPIRVQSLAALGRTLFIATSNPLNDRAIDAVAEMSGMKVSVVLAVSGQIHRAIRKHYYGESDDDGAAGGGEQRYRPSMKSMAGVSLTALKPIEEVGNIQVDVKTTGAIPSLGTATGPASLERQAPTTQEQSGTVGTDIDDAALGRPELERTAIGNSETRISDISGDFVFQNVSGVIMPNDDANASAAPISTGMVTPDLSDPQVVPANEFTLQTSPFSSPVTELPQTLDSTNLRSKDTEDSYDFSIDVPMDADDDATALPGAQPPSPEPDDGVPPATQDYELHQEPVTKEVDTPLTDDSLDIDIDELGFSAREQSPPVRRDDEGLGATVETSSLEDHGLTPMIEGKPEDDGEVTEDIDIALLHGAKAPESIPDATAFAVFSDDADVGEVQPAPEFDDLAGPFAPSLTPDTMSVDAITLAAGAGAISGFVDVQAAPPSSEVPLFASMLEEAAVGSPVEESMDSERQGPSTATGKSAAPERAASLRLLELETAPRDGFGLSPGDVDAPALLRAVGGSAAPTYAGYGYAPVGTDASACDTPSRLKSLDAPRSRDLPNAHGTFGVGMSAVDERSDLLDRAEDVAALLSVDAVIPPPPVLTLPIPAPALSDLAAVPPPPSLPSLSDADLDNIDFSLPAMSDDEARASADAFSEITPNSITTLTPDQLRVLAERMIRRGALTAEDLRAARTDDET